MIILDEHGNIRTWEFIDGRLHYKLISEDGWYFDNIPLGEKK